MVYTYDLTLDDFKASQRLHRKCHLWARLKYDFWFFVVPALGLVALLLLLWDIFIRHYEFPPIVGGILAGLAFGGLYCFFSRPYLMRRAYKRTVENTGDRPVELELRDGELISRIPGRSEGRFQPAAIVDFAEDERLALVYIRKNLFLIVPKHAIPESGMAELRAWMGKTSRC